MQLTTPENSQEACSLLWSNLELELKLEKYLRSEQNCQVKAIFVSLELEHGQGIREPWKRL